MSSTRGAVLFVALLTPACALHDVTTFERIDPTVAAPSLERLARALPGETPEGAASELEARLREVTEDCVGASVERVSTTEVRTRAGDGCPQAHGAVAAKAIMSEGRVVIVFDFDRWSLADGDVLHGTFESATSDRVKIADHRTQPYVTQTRIFDPGWHAPPPPSGTASTKSKSKGLARVVEVVALLGRVALGVLDAVGP